MPTRSGDKAPRSDDIRLGRNQRTIVLSWPPDTKNWYKALEIEEITRLPRNAITGAMHGMVNAGLFESEKRGRGGKRAALYYRRTQKALPPTLMDEPKP